MLYTAGDILAKASVMQHWLSCNVHWYVEYSCWFRYTYSKNSTGFRSGERGRHISKPQYHLFFPWVTRPGTSSGGTFHTYLHYAQISLMKLLLLCVDALYNRIFNRVLQALFSILYVCKDSAYKEASNVFILQSSRMEITSDTTVLRCGFV